MTFRLSYLALLLAAVTLVTMAGGVVATWWVADQEFRDVFEDDLEHQSELLSSLLTRNKVRLTKDDLASLLTQVFESDEEETAWVTVYDVPTGRSVSNLQHELPLDTTQEGEIARRLNGQDWFGYQSRSGDTVVQLLRRIDLYTELRSEILEDIVLPALLGGAATLLLLGSLIALCLGPLARLVGQVESRHADLLIPLAVSTPAREIQILRDALNGLMRDVDAALTRERQFASEVAHELRTPLTTLKLELASATPDLASVRSEVDRLGRFVAQLLTLARLEQGQWERRFDTVQLQELCARAIERLQSRFAAARVDVRSQLQPVTLRGDAVLLDVLVGNLLQNVLTHCPTGTQVQVSLAVTGDRVALRVEDDGPGVSEALRKAMSEDFSRIRSGADGFGLGLAICRRVAAVHRGSLRFPAPPQGSGFVAEVLLPLNPDLRPAD